METVYVALNESDFRNLVAGCVVVTTAAGPSPHRQRVEIILSDIGWERMNAAIDDAMRLRPPAG